jgi:predicted TIM-barrel fold metal-dependent hydrolase
MKKIDAFTHIIPEKLLPIMEERVRQFLAQPYVKARPSLVNLSQRLETIANWGDYSQIITLSTPPLELWTSPDEEQKIARLANEAMAEIVESYPARFAGFAASVNLLDVDSAIKEAEYAVVQLGALGVQIFTNVKGMPLDQKIYEPFFATIEEFKKPIWLHPYRLGSFSDYVGETGFKYGIDVKFGWPYETTVAMTRIIFSGILQKYPDLKIITHHGGGLVPHLVGRLALQHELDEQLQAMDISQEYNQRKVLDEYRKFFADTVFSGEDAPFVCTIEFFGINHVIFASDFPWGPQGGVLFVESTIQSIERTIQDEASKAKIFHQNLEDICSL